jgi:hypothetical protein
MLNHLQASTPPIACSPSSPDFFFFDVSHWSLDLLLPWAFCIVAILMSLLHEPKGVPFLYFLWWSPSYLFSWHIFFWVREPPFTYRSHTSTGKYQVTIYAPGTQNSNISCLLTELPFSTMSSGSWCRMHWGISSLFLGCLSSNPQKSW